MEFSELVLKGILVGIGVSAPVGPIGILCISRSISKGFLSGICTGVGAVVPNMIYTLLAVSGVTKILIPLIEKHPEVTFLSGIYVVYLGITAFKKQITGMRTDISTRGYFKDFVSPFLIMITNPATIISYVIVVSGIGFATAEEFSWKDVFLASGSIMTGASLWWIFLSGISSKFGIKIFKEKISNLNKITGSIIIVFGIMLMIKSLI